MTPSPAKQDYVRQHRRETLLYFIVPLLVTVFIVLLGVVVVLLLQRQLQLSILADWMMTVMVCCPALLCTTVICVGLMAGVALVGRSGGSVLRPVHKLSDLTQNAAERTTRTTDAVNKATVNIASRFAFLDRLLGMFDTPADDNEKRENHND